jgi:hypothetical protein
LATNQKTINNFLNDKITTNNTLLDKRPPPLSIKMEFVYGFHSFEKRKTLHYATIYLDNKIINNKKEKNNKNNKNNLQVIQ